MPETKPRRKLSNASFAWLAVTVLFGLMAAASLWRSMDQPAPAVTRLPAFDLQGHRGARGLAPENTLPGFETALALGVTTLEMDIGMTADGVLVVHHDRGLNPARTRGPDGQWLNEDAATSYLKDQSYAALAGYDVGRARPDSDEAARFPEQAGRDGVAIPKLRDVIARAEALSGGTIRYNIETKVSPEDPESSPDWRAMTEALIVVIQDAGVAERATVQSFDWRSLLLVQEKAPDIITSYLTAEQLWLDNIRRGKDGASPWTADFDVDRYEASVPKLIKAAGGRIWSPYYRDLRNADLAEARRLGLHVIVWTVNDPGDMAALIDQGVDGIITDYPDRLRSVMETKGMTLPPAFQP